MTAVRIDAQAFQQGFRDLAIDIAYAATQAIKAAVSAAEASARGTRLYNDVSGALRQNTRGETSGITGRLSANTKYARWVENGTKPHVIAARGGGLLSFVANGQRVFARRVNHPGTAARPFMAQAAVVGQTTLEYAAESFVGSAISRFGS